MISDKSIYFTK